VLGPPLATLLAQAASYALAPWACNDGGLPMAALHAVMVFFLVVIALCGFLAWSLHQGAGGGWPGEEALVADRNRFLGFLGVGSAAFSALVTLGLWIPNWILDPCLRAQ